MRNPGHIIYKEYRYSEYYVLLPVAFVFIMSLLSCITWILGNQIGNYEINILFKQNTAIAFMCASTSTYCLWFKSKNHWTYPMGKAFAGIVLLIGVTTLYQKIFLINLNFDQPFIYDTSTIDPLFPGQMSLPNAVIFTLLGFALLLNSYESYSNKISTLLYSSIFFVSLIVLIGYVFKADVLYQLQNDRRLSEHSAIAALLVSFAGLFIYPNNKYIDMLKSDSAAGSFARSISLASLILPVLFGRIGFYFYYSTGVDSSTAYASVAISCLITLIMITWKSATAFELVDRDRIGSEKEKVKSTAQIDSLLASSPFGIAFFSSEGQLIRANQLFKKYIQVDSNFDNIHYLFEFKKLIGFLPEQTMLDFIKSTGLGKSFELEMQVDEKTQCISMNLFPVETKSNDFFGLGISFLDITHLKQIEKELISARDSAEVSNRSKSFFLANMSHEIRTPIGIIMGFVDMLNSTNLSDEEKNHNMAIVKRNCRQLLNIIDDILDISKIEAGQVKIRKEFVNTNELLLDLKSILDLKAENKKLKCEIKIKGEIPAKFFTDATRLRQVLLNICGNAIKFTRQGGVSLSCFYKEEKIYFRVSDTGSGIAIDQFDKLFKPFSQVDSSETREFGGTGLGLALSQKLARALGGDLVLETTNPGIGSTFLISVDTGNINSIDFINDTDNEKSSQNKIKTSAEISSDLKEKNILIVDDSPDNRLLISFMLKKLGLKVETAVDGKNALEMAEKNSYDLILMDLQMPIMGGYEAVNYLRKAGFNKPIIALTAHAMKDEKDKCLANGFSAYLTKPIDKNLLISTMSSL